MSAPERRSFFRVNSEIVLSFHTVDSFTLDNSQPETEFPENQQTLDLFNELRRLDKEAAPYLATIQEGNRALSDYLRILNKKIDLVTQQSLAGDYISKEVRPTHANLSEGGIAFNCSRSLYKDTCLAMRIMFLSDYASFATFARVLRCDAHDSGEGYKLACKFLSLSEQKQEMLGRHIMQAQMLAKRQAKN